MNFKIGENVLLNNKTYKIVGTVKRSFMLERDGKKYKATSKMMGKIQDQNNKGIGVGRKTRTKKSSTFYMERRLAYRKIFDADAKMPETEEELMKELDGLCGELSPENLSCDGEISSTQIRKKASAIRAEWKEIEKKLGRKVSEYEAESHWMSTYK
jgi:hypothetical protein